MVDPVRVEVAADVCFVEMFDCGGPEAAPLMDLCWSNALFDGARRMLAELFPRRSFETKFGITVGSPRAGKGGTYFMGRRDLVAGLERRDRMLAKGQLAIYSVQYWDDPFSVSVGIDFTRAVVPPRLHCHFRLEDERTFGYEAVLTEAVFDLVRRGLGVAPTRECEVETWVDDDRQALALLLDARAVERLGGIGAVVAEVPAVSVEPLDGPAAGGALVRFAATPGSLTPDRHRRALDYIAPLTP